MNNTTLNIPITVIVPITRNPPSIEPVHKPLTLVNVYLSNPTTPTVTTLSAAIPTTQQLSASPTATNNTSGETGTNNSSGGTTGSNNTSSTNSEYGDNGPGSASDQSTSIESNSATTDLTQDNTHAKDKKNQDKKDTTSSVKTLALVPRNEPRPYLFLFLSL